MSEATMKDAVSCPYCEHLNTVVIELNPNPKMFITYCDPEDGGCDKPFVCEPSIRLATRSLAIESYPKDEQPDASQHLAPEERSFAALYEGTD